MLPLRSILPWDMDNMSTDGDHWEDPAGVQAKGVCPPLGEIRASLLKKL